MDISRSQAYQPTPRGWLCSTTCVVILWVCLDCYQSMPYQYFGHDHQIGSYLNMTTFWLSNAPTNSSHFFWSMLDNLWARNSSIKIMASQNFGRWILGTNQTHPMAFMCPKPPLMFFWKECGIMRHHCLPIGRIPSYNCNLNHMTTNLMLVCVWFMWVTPSKWILI
jgi:hypothetical protein